MLKVDPSLAPVLEELKPGSFQATGRKAGGSRSDGVAFYLTTALPSEVVVVVVTVVVDSVFGTPL